MADIGKVATGVVLMVFGLFFSVVSWYIVDILLDMASFSTTIQAIFWVGLIIMWILAIVVMPMKFITEGMSA